MSCDTRYWILTETSRGTCVVATVDRLSEEEIEILGRKGLLIDRVADPLPPRGPVTVVPHGRDRCGGCGQFLRKDSYYTNRCSDCWTPEDDF